MTTCGREAADVRDEDAGEGVEGFERELAVVVVEDLVVGDAEDLAGGFELGAAGLAELLVGGGVAAVGGGLTVGEAEDGDFDAAGGVEREGSAEAEAFVVGVGGDAEEAEGHRVPVARC